MGLGRCLCDWVGEELMRLLIKEYVKRDGRGKARKVHVYASFDYPGIFDTPYDSASHRQFILRELRYRTGPPPAFLGRSKKKSQRISKYERHVPSQWEAAILRDAPLLKGFFAEVPRWREEMLRWCERNLDALSASKRKSSAKEELVKPLSEARYRFTFPQVSLT
jgi:hypothetical protein